jgi:hypothetical protein
VANDASYFADVFGLWNVASVWYYAGSLFAHNMASEAVLVGYDGGIILHRHSLHNLHSFHSCHFIELKFLDDLNNERMTIRT